MRLLLCGVSTLMLSACSLSGGGIGGMFGNLLGHSDGGDGYYYGNGSNYSGKYAQNPNAAGQQAGRNVTRSGANHCQIQSPTQPIPQGCSPDQVTLGLGGASSSSAAAYGGATNSGGQYTNGGYGSHAADARRNVAFQSVTKQARRPKLRGSFGLEIDHSVSGDLYRPGISNAVANYNRPEFAEGSVSGSIASGEVTTMTYTSSDARLGRVIAPNISYDDVHTAPFRISAGAEYIMSDHATVFGNVGYTHAEGKKGGGVQINEELLLHTDTEGFITDPANGVVGTSLGTIRNTTFVPNETVASFNYDFNEMKRFDVELGGRYYFNPIAQQKLSKTLTPFVSGSAGMAHYNEVTVTESQQQRFMQRAFEGTEDNPTGDFYDIKYGSPETIYDAQWVPYGSLKAGLEYQLSPKTALALEAGLKYESGRDFSNGTDGDNNITVPVTIRGSYNF